MQPMANAPPQSSRKRSGHGVCSMDDAVWCADRGSGRAALNQAP
jgi:hypothetical protein